MEDFFKEIPVWLTFSVWVVLSLCGGGGLVAVLLGRSQSHKTHAEGTKAEAEATVAEAVARKTDAETESISVATLTATVERHEKDLKACIIARDKFEAKVKELEAEHAQINKRITKIENGGSNVKH